MVSGDPILLHFTFPIPCRWPIPSPQPILHPINPAHYPVQFFLQLRDRFIVIFSRNMAPSLWTTLLFSVIVVSSFPLSRCGPRASQCNHYTLYPQYIYMNMKLSNNNKFGEMQFSLKYLLLHIKQIVSFEYRMHENMRCRLFYDLCWKWYESLTIFP